MILIRDRRTILGAFGFTPGSAITFAADKSRRERL
jgi:hypothetical protein